MRIGYGFDVHQFGGEAPLKIGGVHIPDAQGLLAHSDGDVALHALTDALLGAAALGDIGKWFPDTSDIYKGIESRILLREVWRRISSIGYYINNLDITLISQKPNITTYIPKMRMHISEDLECNIDSVSIKATTAERLGSIGRGEGIACSVVVLLL